MVQCRAAASWTRTVSYEKYSRYLNPKVFFPRNCGSRYHHVHWNVAGASPATTTVPSAPEFYFSALGLIRCTKPLQQEAGLRSCQLFCLAMTPHVWCQSNPRMYDARVRRDTCNIQASASKRFDAHACRTTHVHACPCKHCSNSRVSNCVHQITSHSHTCIAYVRYII